MKRKFSKGSDMESFFDKEKVVISATECTGLTQTPPLDEEAVDSYTDIYDIPLAKNAKEHEQIK